MSETEQPWPPHSGVPAKDRFKKAIGLKWGETPFDDLTRTELLRLVQAYHSALVAARSVMLQYAEAVQSPYWSGQGSGGRALLKANYLVKLCGDGGMNEESEKIYRSFFRSADVLLFPHLRNDSFSNWGINDGGEMCAPYRAEDGYRPIEWKDVCPQPAEED